MSGSVPAPVSRRFLIVGGAGFVGSHFTDRLLGDAAIEQVTLYDNFSSGREWHHAAHTNDPRFTIVRAEVAELDRLTEAMRGHDTVIHLASNPDIARAMSDPEVDFREGTALTNTVVEAMRRAGVGRILYASGSGIYGDLGDREISEDHGPLVPISTYGASKLAGEALISAYCYMFGMTGLAFRFGNVVGPRQTHGVGFDFIRRLMADPTQLTILGDGRQSKSYIHVGDVVDAVLTANQACTTNFEAFNVATGDYITVTEIAELAIECLQLSPKPQLHYRGGDRGWKGDVPVVRLNTDRIRQTGWVCRRGCREALRQSMLALIREESQGLL